LEFGIVLEEERKRLVQSSFGQRQCDARKNRQTENEHSAFVFVVASDKRHIVV